jgi:hypothetical protein
MWSQAAGKLAIYGADGRLTQDAQKGRPARPQGVGRLRRTREGTSQGDTGLRTPLTGFFSSLLDLPQSYWPVGLAGLLEFFHMTSESWAEFGGEDCFSVGRDVLLDLLDGFCQLFNQSLA